MKYNLSQDKLISDTNKVEKEKTKTQSINIGGIFISPSVGLAFPLGVFSSNVGTGTAYGAKLEFAFMKLYPFVVSAVYEGQKYKGNAGFMNNNLLTEFSTNVAYFGGSLDIILNKFLKSDFTTPILSLEIKYAKVSRDVAPDTPLPGISFDQSLLTYSGSLAFTIYVFDLATKYTLAGEYSNLNFQIRFHFPVVKF
ncbi:MAG: hypothetical protein IPL53_13665 [Ignavibacteria bacterium]|nr:hypothetical protein [Ignavibacteria bacterium]